MFKPLLIAILALAVVAAVVFVGGKYWGEEAEETVSLPQTKVEEWKIYRNQEYGFEFRYPVEINNRVTSLTENGSNILLFENSQSGYSQHITLNIKSLNESLYTPPEASPRNVLNVGKGFDRVVYDSKSDLWYFWDGVSGISGELSNFKKMSWDDVFVYLQYNKPLIKTYSGQIAFYYAGAQTEGYNSWTGYHIFDRSNSLYLNFIHSTAYLPYGDIIENLDGTKDYLPPKISQEEVDREDIAIDKIIEEIIKTIHIF